MPTFAYAGRTRGGQTVTGERLADTMDAAVAALRREQILVTPITPAKVKTEPVEKKAKVGKTGKRVGQKDLVIFTRQFSTMIDAGLPLVQCLDILSSQSDNATFRDVLIKVKNKVEQGATFADSLKDHPIVVRRALRAARGRRRNRRYSRHDSEPPHAVHRKGSEASRERSKARWCIRSIVLTVAVGVTAVLLLYVTPILEDLRLPADAAWSDSVRRRPVEVHAGLHSLHGRPAPPSGSWDSGRSTRTRRAARFLTTCPSRCLCLDPSSGRWP